MSFGRNLQFLRKMHGGMTQEELAERMNVSRQTVSKWELDTAFPEMEKAVTLSRIFNCSLDDLILNDIDIDNKAYSCMRVEKLEAFGYFHYTVISAEPEDDAIRRIKNMAEQAGIAEPDIIGWDFPFVSQEQTNVYRMHGYTAACILHQPVNTGAFRVCTQPASRYSAITVREPFTNPFTLIPNAYKTLMRYMDSNGLNHKEGSGIIACFEREYEKDGISFMDIYITLAD